MILYNRLSFSNIGAIKGSYKKNFRFRGFDKMVKFKIFLEYDMYWILTNKIRDTFEVYREYLN